MLFPIFSELLYREYGESHPSSVLVALKMFEMKLQVISRGCLKFQQKPTRNPENLQQTPGSVYYSILVDLYLSGIQ
ncbi:hypothetical protein D1164_17045 [Mariniphaga sediminis]|jgi:hypothetical protein|uniref:Uncharacterized protein n=1 Tax=Mariniphaga sediminis TaxID=1628158 RepID=A0A399CXF1_9BACT|nr:hypothetical protein D1164_17045 [Mariniphaga sediminis]